LHVDKNEMPNILEKLSRALNKKGLIYASFKAGEKEVPFK